MIIHLGWLALLLLIIGFVLEFAFHDTLVDIFDVTDCDCPVFSICLIMALMSTVGCLAKHDHRLYVNCESPKEEQIRITRIHEKYQEATKTNITEQATLEIQP